MSDEDHDEDHDEDYDERLGWTNYALIGFKALLERLGLGKDVIICYDFNEDALIFIFDSGTSHDPRIEVKVTRTKFITQRPEVISEFKKIATALLENEKLKKDDQESLPQAPDDIDEYGEWLCAMGRQVIMEKDK